MKTPFDSTLKIALFLPAAGFFLIFLTQPAGVHAAQVTPTPGFTPRASSTSWIIITDVPPDANQADRGAEIYRLVCKSCHGDLGQGLTTDWREKWNPQDQNCWQSKCHASNHPPDGFEIPFYVPAVIGPGSLQRFDTALDLYEFNHTYMPWHDPNSMLPEESWQVTAYLLRENHIDPIQQPLDTARAAKIVMHPGRDSLAPTDHPAPATAVAIVTALATAAPVATDSEGPGFPWIVAVLVVVALTAGAFVVLLRSRPGN
ncbi:MAG: hypothetical protein GYA17_00950 [Chloroflexi bacterium]|nr:hypothetical protein [Chloroflexota bacterium]